MKNTPTLDRLAQKPLNAKYYPYDLEHVNLVDQKKNNFFKELSQFVTEVMTIIHRPSKD